jgi:DICT domain-containing protein
VSSAAPSSPEDGLTIAQMAQRTGVSAATLRAWETRYGFPRPQRTPSGRRRYAPDDAERVARVARDRDTGMSIALAIARATEDDGEPATVRSWFGELRRRRPDLDVHVLSMRAMVALSRAIEDESFARAERPLVYATFQRERFYRAVGDRWRELGRSADVAVVFADFPALRRPDGAPAEVPLEPSSPLMREWSLVCDAPEYAACLVGWERHDGVPAGDRRRAFETVWSVDPEVVRHAARLGNALAEPALPDLARRAADRLAQAPQRIGPRELRIAATLTSRMAAYLSVE